MDISPKADAEYQRNMNFCKRIAKLIGRNPYDVMSGAIRKAQALSCTARVIVDEWFEKAENGERIDIDG